jgi:hypothetical protein
MEPHACGLIFEEERLCVVDGDRRGKEVFAVSKLWVYRRLWQTAQFQSCAVTKYLSVERRIWVADRYAAQAGHGEQRQLCLALLLRDAQYAIDSGDTGLAAGFHKLLQRAVGIGHRRADLKSSPTWTAGPDFAIENGGNAGG